MTGAEMRRAWARMAHEIIERNHGADNLLIAGVPTRGKYLSIRLADLIEQFESVSTTNRSPRSFLLPRRCPPPARERHQRYCTFKWNEGR